ncbi:hypothetical protein HAX54_014302 [Datura stramonium]|uniref:Uncharacterized protein n=1 Tax=Datura stramonium TaxID=4076 RepID=A0ABS8Y7H0_DATST|nr:hypothetical protein [Datura stramonium]
MEGEIHNFIVVWAIVLTSLCYSHTIARFIPKGKSRFVAIIPEMEPHGKQYTPSVRLRSSPVDDDGQDLEKVGPTSSGARDIFGVGANA